MDEKQIITIGILIVVFVVFIVIVNLLDNRSIDGIKAKTVGDGQHGTARWATKPEIKNNFVSVTFEPEKWRKGEDLPTVQGTVVGLQRTAENGRTGGHGRRSYADDRCCGRGQDGVFLVSKFRVCLCIGNVVSANRYQGRCCQKLRKYSQKLLWIQCFGA